MNVTNAMQEMFQGVEKFKKEQNNSKTDINKQIQQIIADIQKIQANPTVAVAATTQNAPSSAGGNAANQTQGSKFNSSISNMDVIGEVKAAMTKFLENKIIDLEFNLNNRIVTAIASV